MFRKWNVAKLLMFNWNMLQGNGCFLRKVIESFQKRHCYSNSIGT